MNEFQKVIKYIAIGFAIFLAVSIIFAIVSGITLTFRIFNLSGNFISGVNQSQGGRTIEEGVSEEFDDIDNIYINHGAGSLVVRTGETDKVIVYVEGKDNGYNIKASGNRLNVEHNRDFNNFFNFGDESSFRSQLIITVPQDLKLEELDIDAGAGEISLQGFKAKEFNLDAGAGLVTITDVEADEVEVNGGAGKLLFDNVVFSDSNISCGVGLVDFTGKLLNDNEIDAGVGKLILNIRGEFTDYDIDIDKGLGEITIDGKRYEDVNLKQKNANHSLDIDGGVGSIKIKFSGRSF